MRKSILAVVISASLLISLTDATAMPTFQSSTTETADEAPAPLRVYGLDYSREIFDSISKASFQEYIMKLTENGSRWIQTPQAMSEANTAVRDWIARELTRVSAGRIEVEILGNYQSVLGRLPGYLPVDAPGFLVGGHFDTVIEAPGANDDGSGVATMLELARVFSQYQWPLDIYFGAWNAEEIGLEGSQEVARILSDRGVELLVHYNIDMLLVPSPFRTTILMAYPFGAYHNGEYWADLPKALSNNYGKDVIQPISENDFAGWTSSDHFSFLMNGFERSLLAHESGFGYDSAYHSTGDVWNNPLYDYDTAIEGVKAIGASIAFTMQRAYQRLIQENYKLNLNPGSQNNYSITISGQTMINVTSRWWGGPITFRLFGPNNQLLSEAVMDRSSPWEMSSVIEQPVSTMGIYKLFVINQGSAMVGCNLTYEYDSDIDGNAIPDSEEFWFDAIYFTIDSDLDSLSDAREMIIGTSWVNQDSDFDSMPDNWELVYGLNPLDPSDASDDEDGDTLTNLEEFQYGSNPLLTDSDFDQMPDDFEVAHNLNPAVNDASEDPDHDLVTNIDEYLQGTDPQYAELRLERIAIPITLGIGVIIILAVAGMRWYKRH
jgi:hypothetical protein